MKECAARRRSKEMAPVRVRIDARDLSGSTSMPLKKSA